MDITEKQLERQKEKTKMLLLFSKHNNLLTHQQCQDAGISDPQAVVYDLASNGHRIMCAVQHHMFIVNGSLQSWSESNYELMYSG